MPFNLSPSRGFDTSARARFTNKACRINSFTPLIERWRVRQATENLVSTIHFARSEAIKRGGGITIDATGGWNTGWKITHTENGTTTDLQVIAGPSNLTLVQSNTKTKVL